MKVPSPTRSSLKSYLMAIIFFFFSQSFCRSCCLPGSSGSGSLTRLQRTSWFSGLFKAIPGREGNGDPLQYSCLENAMDGGAWWAAVHGVLKSRTRLSDCTFTFHSHALEKELATHSSVLAGESQGRGAWWAAVYGVAQSRTRLRRLSCSSSSRRICFQAHSCPCYY